MIIFIIMHKIIKKRELASKIFDIEILAPRIARKARAGNFVIIRIDEEGERIPLTIADWSKDKGTIEVVVLEAGATTKKLNSMKEGDYIIDCIGPLGNPSEISNFGKVVAVGGGVGIPAIYPIIKALKEAGNYIISIIGARSSNLIIYEDEVGEFSDELYIATDDGSNGIKGFVTGPLKSIIEKERIDRVIAIGPAIMMKNVSKITDGIKTMVSLNSIMVDGTGMCGACRVEVGGETKFTCVDGPEFDGHLVDFDLLLSRLNMYKDKELVAYETK